MFFLSLNPGVTLKSSFPKAPRYSTGPRHAIRPAFTSRPLHILDPLDARSTAWDIAKDSTSPLDAQAVTSLFVADDSRETPYARDAARALLLAAIEALNALAPGNWGLVHLIAAFDGQNLRGLLKQAAPTRSPEAIRQALRLAKSDVRGLVQAKLHPFKPLAAAWQYAQTRVSISEWLNSNGILVLAHHERYKDILAPLNQLLLRLAIRRLLTQPMPVEEWTRVFLPDLRALGTFDDLAALLAKGPDSNTSVVLSLADIETAAHPNGPSASDLADLCGNYAFLRIASPATAAWASGVIGNQQVLLVHQHQARLGSDLALNFTTVPTQRPAVSTDKLRQLPDTRDEKGLTGYFKNASSPPYRGHLCIRSLTERRAIVAPVKDVAAYQPVPAERLRFPDDTSGLCQGLAQVRDAMKTSVVDCYLSDPGPDPTEPTPEWDQPFDPAMFPRITLPG